ncbi:sensor domain-containing diguanylate cyclase [Clostridium paraputrificum]|uniref:sensor domain-containing diguanylate cyclase n=1 Tax=Clostridium paraputrificum TaxID=29363 RepID=UPI003D3299B3
MKKNSIIRKVEIAVIIPILLQGCFFAIAIFRSSIIPALVDNTFNIFYDKVNNKQTYIEDQMLQNWSNINNQAEEINSYILNILENKGVSTKELNSNNSLSNEVLTDISEDIINMVHKNYTTDFFIVFDTVNENSDNLNVDKKEGIYIKDINPVGTNHENSDLYIEIGSVDVVKNLKISPASNWKSKYTLNKEEADNDFFYKPISELKEYEYEDIREFRYWGKPSNITNPKVKVITYSIPLINNEGILYGVIGVGIDLNYINEILTKNEKDNKTSYAIMVESNNSDNNLNLEDIIGLNSTSEEILNYYKNENMKIDNIYDNIHKLTTGKKKDTGYIFKKEINLYKTNDRFSEEKWNIVLLIKRGDLFQPILKTLEYLVSLIIASTAIGIFLALILVRKVTRSTRDLAKKVRESNPREPIRLEEVNILEIDELSAAITTLSRNVAEESSKLNKVINLLNIPLGAFKYRNGEESVYCTKGIFKVLGIEGVHEAPEYLDLETFQLLIEDATKVKYENEEKIYILKKDNEERLIKIIVQEDENVTIGIITDVTKEISEKIKIEYDRDHDVLTGLLNRRAFRRKCMDKLKKNNINTAAFIMLDLDNLKFVNDSYGHEYGDKYIQKAANILKEFKKHRSLVSRISGDEFSIFIYGYENKGEILDIVKEIHRTMKNTIFYLPGSNELMIRASVGIAWYPENSEDYDTLVKYSDFAMYSIKNTTKGDIAEFNEKEYREYYL